MPNEVERKRLKKKMLDRWENEGGRIAADPVTPDQGKPASQKKGKDSQPRASNSSSRKKRRTLTQK